MNDHKRVTIAQSVFGLSILVERDDGVSEPVAVVSMVGCAALEMSAADLARVVRDALEKAQIEKRL